MPKFNNITFHGTTHKVWCPIHSDSDYTVLPPIQDKTTPDSEKRKRLFDSVESLSNKVNLDIMAFYDPFSTRTINISKYDIFSSAFSSKVFYKCLISFYPKNKKERYLIIKEYLKIYNLGIIKGYNRAIPPYLLTPISWLVDLHS